MKDESLQHRFASDEPIFSIEFFPPKSEAAAKQLLRTAEEMQAFDPDFVSITYGAGGSTRSRTLKYARQLYEDYNYTVMPHLTCVGHSRDELIGIVRDFKEAGLRQIMALRGDPPKGETDFKAHPDGLHYANELVELIREYFTDCAIGVGGYPEKHLEAPSFEVDLLNLKRKVDAGAHFITTQLFFDNSCYFAFVEAAREIGINVPILPGLMMTSSLPQAQRFCEMGGSFLPPELADALETAGEDKEKGTEIGLEWSFQQARELLEKGAPGLHLYILNRTKPAATLMQRLKSAGFYTA
ncbi:MAG: methylenetetrahydrofolate reductase [NAD(P)H] [Verrucomicrobia bacterium]|jgi:methylenetetrahydrofolate reductase (NADPH)|nr:methylenetetrahydrofolate reductase [NAD(P)H] [Verrucomicrobiota bacterium]